MRIGLTTSIATAIAIGVLVLSGGGNPPAWDNLANLWVDTTGGTCTRQASHVAYDDAAACASLAAAYSAAQSSDIIGVRGGSYANQTVSGGTKTVTFRVVANETANFSAGGSHNNDSLFIDASNVTIYGPVDLPDVNEVSLWVQCADNVTFHDVSGHAGFFVTDGASNVSFYGGEWGDVTGVPGGYTGDPDSAIGTNGDVVSSGRPNCSTQGDPVIRNVLIDGVHFHDNQYISQSSWTGHPDCLQMTGASDGVTIRNSIFERCGADFLFLASDFGDMKNILIENNVFRAVTSDSSWAMQIGWKAENSYICSVVFRNNTVDTSVGGGEHASRINCATRAPGTSLAYGNIFTQGPGTGGDDCSAWGGWSYNVYEALQCGANAQQGTITFADRPTSDTDSVYDYTPASGSIAVGAGKPGSSPTDFPATDIAGRARTSPPDAGAYERP